MQSLTLSPPLIQLFANGFTRLSGHAIFNTVLPEWRNWQTQQTQNLPGITPRVGSTPSSGTNILKEIVGIWELNSAPPRKAVVHFLYTSLG